MQSRVIFIDTPSLASYLMLRLMRRDGFLKWIKRDLPTHRGTHTHTHTLSLKFKLLYWHDIITKKYKAFQFRIEYYTIKVKGENKEKI